MADFASVYQLANRPTVELQDPLTMYGKAEQVKALRMANQDAMAQRKAGDDARMLFKESGGDWRKAAGLATERGLMDHAAKFGKIADEHDVQMSKIQEAASKMDEGQRQELLKRFEQAGKSAVLIMKQPPEKRAAAAEYLAQTLGMPELKGMDADRLTLLASQVDKVTAAVSSIGKVEADIASGAIPASMAKAAREQAYHVPGRGGSGGGAGSGGGVSLPSGPGASQNYAERLVKGLEPWPTAVTIRTDPVVREGLQLARQIDPEFNAATHNQRRKTYESFTTGKEAQTVNALNTAMGHLAELSDWAEKLKNYDTQALNKARNWTRNQFGNSDIAGFNTTKKAVADEVTRVWRGTGGSEADIQEAMTNLSSDQSPAQLRTAILQLTKLMASKQKALEDQYVKGMGRFGDLEIMNEEAKHGLSKIQERGGVKPTQESAKPAKWQPTQPVGAPDVKTLGKNPRFPQAVWMGKGAPQGGGWYVKENGMIRRVE